MEDLGVMDDGLDDFLRRHRAYEFPVFVAMWEDDMTVQLFVRDDMTVLSLKETVCHAVDDHLVPDDFDIIVDDSDMLDDYETLGQIGLSAGEYLQAVPFNKD